MMITITKMIKKNEDGYDDDDNDSKPTSYGFLAAVLSPGLIMTIISLAPQWPFTRIGLSSQIFITYLAFFRLFIYSFFLYYFIIFLSKPFRPYPFSALFIFLCTLSCLFPLIHTLSAFIFFCTFQYSFHSSLSFPFLSSLSVFFLLSIL